jgi:hypothetical protein
VRIELRPEKFQFGFKFFVLEQLLFSFCLYPFLRELDAHRQCHAGQGGRENIYLQKILVLGWVTLKQFPKRFVRIPINSIVAGKNQKGGSYDSHYHETDVRYISAFFQEARDEEI